MKRLPYFDNLAHVISLFDDELLVELLARLRLELATRGKSDAANYVERARRTIVIDAQLRTPSA